MKCSVCGGVHQPRRTCTRQGGGCTGSREGSGSPGKTQAPSLAVFLVGWVAVASLSQQCE